MTVADPTFNKELSMISIPEADRREHLVDGKIVTGDFEIDRPTTVLVRAKRGYKLPQGSQTEFTFDPNGVEDIPVIPVVEDVVDVVPDVAPEVTQTTVDTSRFGRR